MEFKTKDFESACEVLGIAPILPDVGPFSELYQKEITNRYKAQVIADAINKESDFTPNWDDRNQYKYEPRFIRSGSGWAYCGYGLWFTRTSVGSRLYFANDDTAEYFGELIISLGLMI